MPVDVVSKLAPSVFAFYLVIGANFLPEIVGCRMRQFMSQSMLAKHALALLLMFFLVVLINPTANEKTLALNVMWAVLIYTWFLMTTYSPLPLAFLSIALLLVIYLLNGYKSRLEEEKKEADANRVAQVQTTFAVIALVLAVVGFSIYAYEKKLEYGSKFELLKFLQGKIVCRNYTPKSAKVL